MCFARLWGRRGSRRAVRFVVVTERDPPVQSRGGRGSCRADFASMLRCFANAQHDKNICRTCHSERERRILEMLHFVRHDKDVASTTARSETTHNPRARVRKAQCPRATEKAAGNPPAPRCCVEKPAVPPLPCPHAPIARHLSPR